MVSHDITDESPFHVIAAALDHTVEAAVVKLRAMSETQAAQPTAAGKWSPKQLVGHLIDSAANNHQRFVRAQEGDSYSGPQYAQDHWVAVQGYQDARWDDLITLWRAYNRHLASVIARIPEAKRRTPMTIGSYATVSLGFVAADYVTHMRHHLAQAGALSD